MKISELQKNIKEGKNLTEYDNETLKYIQKPLGKALYLNLEENKTENDGKENAKWNDKLKCKICGRITLRSNQSKHKKTKYHMAYENMNQKIRDLLLK
jgi:hypothetical protein